ncbi:MAG: trehalose-phosphatase [Phycisphaerae bacterium]|nr:trehalose-phosphatase [Phycisphaerae bacterium]
MALSDLSRGAPPAGPPLLDARALPAARTQVLLVACDFDGTIARIAGRPGDVTPEPAALTALRGLAALHHTHVVVISGRGLEDLRNRLGTVDGARLVGSHGAELDGETASRLTPDILTVRDQIRAAVRHAAEQDTRLHCEEKPLGAALHDRDVPDDVAAVARAALAASLHGLPGIHERTGKRVIEYGALPADKGSCLTAMRQRLGATATIFLGDDSTDEDVFRILRPGDLGIKIGEGESFAALRLDGPIESAEFLTALLRERVEWQHSGHAVPIERHTMLSDQRTVALLTPEARIVWCCLPRIDSPALFGELLGGPMAGHFAISPVRDDEAPTQRYVGDSFVVETAWPSMRITDCLDCSAGRPFLRAGRTDLVRIIQGSGQARLSFAPRLDFGRRPTHLRIVPEGIVVEGTLDPVVLRSPGIAWTLVEEGPHHRAEAIVALGPEPLALELRYGLSTTKELVAPVAARIDQTRRFWELWTGSLRLPPIHRDLVLRSALVIKGLCYGPTGAISAAGTTSLPESIGGVRNWDYRFCWLRDAALAATSLARLGSTGIGTKFLDWMLGVLDSEGSPERFRPVYTVTGNHLGAEAEIGELVGYRGSRPVRVGNAAAQQLQLDVFGPILDLLAVLADGGMALSAEHWRLTEAIVQAVGLRWTEPDHGIWEVRGPLRHHVHSKVMCWVAVDRGIAIARAFASEPPPEWLVLREEISADILHRGWNADMACFTAAYGETTIDASALHVGLSGLLRGDDPRFLSTVRRVEESLREGSTVYRYRFDDGLPGTEGGFQLCTTWLIEAIALCGERRRARALLDDYASRFGPTGLAAEEYLVATNEWLGNHPQAYSHLGLINAALALGSGGVPGTA